MHTASTSNCSAVLCSPTCLTSRPTWNSCKAPSQQPCFPSCLGPGHQGLRQRQLHFSVLQLRAEKGQTEPAESYKQIDVTLRRPLGLTLAENTTEGTVFVEDIARGGNAENSGKVAVGDVLTKVSATVLKAGKDGQYEKEGYGQRPYDNWEKIMFDCKGQDFSTVMSAIDSNNPRWGINDVTLVLKRKQ